MEKCFFDGADLVPISTFDLDEIGSTEQGFVYFYECPRCGASYEVQQYEKLPDDIGEET